MTASRSRAILKSESTQDIVFGYQPKEFPLVVTPSANDFVNKQEFTSTDFQINPFAAEQSGVARLQKDALNDRIEQQALERLKDVQEKAYKEAYSLGLSEGSERAFNEQKGVIGEKLTQLDQLLLELVEMKKKVLADHESHVMRLIFQIASRIGMREIQVDQTIVLAAVQQVVADMQGDEQMIIRVASQDLQFLEMSRPKIGREAQTFSRLRFEASESITPGGCLVETNYGSIDATIERRVDRAWETIEQKLPKPDQRSSGIGE